jgi:hypothetical protein
MAIDDKLRSEDSPLVERPPAYRSYLLRFWQERSEQLPQTFWRFSLEEPLTSRRQGFSSLEALTSWLRAETTGAQDVAGESV